MSARSRPTYLDERLNVQPAEAIVPRREHGVIVGLDLGRVFIPRPVLGTEHEHNIAAQLPHPAQGKPDDVAIPYLLDAVRSLAGRPARGVLKARRNDGPCDRGRLVVAGPGFAPIQIYDDLSKLEVVFGLHTSAKGLIALQQAFLPQLREIISLAQQNMAQSLGADPRLLVHLSGGYGDSSCATIHLNIPWAKAVSHAVGTSMEAFPFLQESLVRQLATASSVAATGFPAKERMLTNPRSHRFNTITGVSTLEPSRAMHFDLLRGRPTEGYDRPGVARNMGMCSCYGQSQVGNFLTLSFGQIETLRLHFAVCGRWDSPKLLETYDNLLALGAEFAEDHQRSSQYMRPALDDYRAFVSWLKSEVGQEVVDDLIPDCEEALAWAEKVLSAVEQNDQDALIRTTDLGKKMLLVDEYLSGRSGGWREHADEIARLCCVFSSPQEHSFYNGYFCPNGLETPVVNEEDIRNAGPDRLTRTWLVAQLLRKFSHDPLMDHVDFDWDRLELTYANVLSGGWVPRIRIEKKAMLLPNSIGHNAPAIGNLLDGIDSLADVFEVLGTTPQQAATV
ncbi:MAG: hypothetical protein FJ276_19960 [Planctomycetes bacterium]|nr:hypothetical protein [Planctomycetota bacterium]